MTVHPVIRHVPDAVCGRGTLPLPVLIAATFLSAAGARIMDPLLTIVAHDFQISATTASATIAAFTIGYGANQLLLGLISDRYGKLKVLFGALVGYALAMGACATAGNLSTLTFLRVGAGAAAGGLVPTCLAYIGDWVAYNKRQVVISQVFSGFMIGQILSGPIGGVLGQLLGWQAPFILLSMCSLLVVMWLGFRLQSLPDRQSTDVCSRRQNIRHLLTRSVPRKLLLITLIEGALFAGSFPFIASYLHNTFALSYAACGLVVSCFGIGALLYTQNASWIIPKLGETKLVFVGGMLVIVGFVLASLSDTWLPVLIVELLLGVGYFSLHGVLQTRATELLPEARTIAVSTFIFMLFLGQSLGSLGMSRAIAVIGYRSTFLVYAVGIMMFTAFTAWFVHHTSTKICID